MYCLKVGRVGGARAGWCATRHALRLLVPDYSTDSAAVGQRQVQDLMEFEECETTLFYNAGTAQGPKDEFGRLAPGLPPPLPPLPRVVATIAVVSTGGELRRGDARPRRRAVLWVALQNGVLFIFCFVLII